MKYRVLVRLKSGVLDVQGKAVENGLHDTGLGEGEIKNVSNIRIGKLIEFEIDSKNAAEGSTLAKDLCEKLLVNTVLESYELKELKEEV